MKRPPFLLVACTLVAVTACSGSDDEPKRDVNDDESPIDAGSRRDAGRGTSRSDAGPGSGTSDAGAEDDASGDAIWRPAPGTSWQWQLTGELDLTLDVEMYDIDLFSTSRSQVDALHRQGRRVVCYFDTAYEPYRPDEARLRPYRGEVIDGWPDQTWLDIRKPEVVAVMRDRIALAAARGCDGVEADDVDIANNGDTGFAITQEEQRAFIRTLAREAHAQGLAYGLKNALDDVEALRDEVDFAVNEQCFAYDECDKLTPLVRAGKAVFHVEYPRGDQTLEEHAETFCSEANRLDFDSLAKRLDLDAERVACR